MEPAVALVNLLPNDLCSVFKVYIQAQYTPIKSALNRNTRRGD